MSGRAAFHIEPVNGPDEISAFVDTDPACYSLTGTIVREETRSLLEYERHLEACYCVGGKGEDTGGQQSASLPRPSMATSVTVLPMVILGTAETCATTTPPHASLDRRGPGDHSSGRRP